MEWTADDTNSFNRIHAGLPKGHNRSRVPLDPDDFSRGANHLGSKDGDIANAGPDIKDTLPGGDAGLAEYAFRERGETRGLVDQARVFCVGVAEGVSGKRFFRRHMGEELYHRSSGTRADVRSRSRSSFHCFAEFSHTLGDSQL
jgi:hypothetical protein